MLDIGGLAIAGVAYIAGQKTVAAGRGDYAGILQAQIAQTAGQNTEDAHVLGVGGGHVEVLDHVALSVKVNPLLAQVERCPFGHLAHVEVGGQTDVVQAVGHQVGSHILQFLHGVDDEGIILGTGILHQVGLGIGVVSLGGHVHDAVRVVQHGVGIGADVLEPYGILGVAGVELVAEFAGGTPILHVHAGVAVAAIA